MLDPNQILRRRRLDQRLRSCTGFRSQINFAKDYNVTDRTIRNDLVWLESNAGDIAKIGQRRFYVDKNCPSPFHLSESQTMALLLGHTALCQYGGSAFEKEAKEIFDTVLTKVLDPDLRNRIAVLTNAVKFPTQHNTTDTIRPILYTLFTGHLNEKTVNIQYCKADQTVSNRAINPYTFVNVNGEWSLLAFCELRKKILQFKVHRIQEAIITSNSYTILDDYDPTDYLSEGFDNFRDDKPFHFEIEFSEQTSPHIKAHWHHVTQEITPLDHGGCLLRFESEGLPAVAQWIMRYGAGATVINPPELVEYITNEIQQMQENYKKRKG